MPETKQMREQQTDNESDISPIEPKDLRDQTLEDDIDEILDAIDDVLEENAEFFVKSYVQKSGQ